MCTTTQLNSQPIFSRFSISVFIALKLPSRLRKYILPIVKICRWPWLKLASWTRLFHVNLLLVILCAQRHNGILNRFFRALTLVCYCFEATLKMCTTTEWNSQPIFSRFSISVFIALKRPSRLRNYILPIVKIYRWRWFKLASWTRLFHVNLLLVLLCAHRHNGILNRFLRALTLVCYCFESTLHIAKLLHSHRQNIQVALIQTC